MNSFPLYVYSSRAESKCSQRQQKALNSTVHRLSRKVKQLQQENSELREELDTDSPAGGIKGCSFHIKLLKHRLCHVYNITTICLLRKSSFSNCINCKFCVIDQNTGALILLKTNVCLLGYREWSKQRLLRRLLEVETVRANRD